jgi:uncharacterized protein (DUF58 family)
MWKTFATSVVLLVIAMMAALYSSSIGRDGHMPGAALSAVLALGISAWVAIKFVPRLASSVDWGWLGFFSQYHITREGWIYFGAVTVVLFAAVNTANNLLYMVLSALLAVLLLSGVLSALNFRFVRIGIRIPPHCFAGEPFPISIQTHNDKRVFPTLSLRLEPADDCAFRFSTFYVSVVNGLSHASQTGQTVIRRRGHYKLRSVRSVSRYPFGFFLKDHNYSVDAECTCYPEIMPKEHMNLSILDSQGSNERFERGPGQDLYMIRDYVPSDSARHVHWKASAKTSTLKTREYAAEESRRIVFAFDRFGHPGDTEKFEQLVSYAASLVYHVINEGIEAAFASDEWRSVPGNPQQVLESILEYLALVQPSTSAGLPAIHRAGSVRLSLRP